MKCCCRRELCLTCGGGESAHADTPADSHPSSVFLDCGERTVHVHDRIFAACNNVAVQTSSLRQGTVNTSFTFLLGTRQQRDNDTVVDSELLVPCVITTTGVFLQKDQRLNVSFPTRSSDSLCVFCFFLNRKETKCLKLKT